MAAECKATSPNRMRKRPPRKRASKDFSIEEIKSLEPEHVPYYVTDRNGFAVRVLPSGIKTFYFKYTFDGKKNQIKLGKFVEKPGDISSPASDEVTLEMAQDRHDKLRMACRTGIDPKKGPDAPLPVLAPGAKSYAAMTVDELADAYKKFMEKSKNRAASTNSENVRTMDRYILPFFRQHNLVNVIDVKKSHAVSLVTHVSENPLREGREWVPGQARAVLKVARAMFNFGIENDDGTHANPFSITKRHAIEPLMENQKEGRALDDDEIAFLWHSLNSPNGPGSVSAARSLMLILVTGQRPGEVTGMHRKEIKGNWWQIPSQRIKTRRKRKQSHRVFLTPLAKKIIGNFNGYIFPSPSPGCEDRPICESTVAQLVNKANVDLDNKVTRPEWLGLSQEWTPNDLRKTARTLLPRIGCPADIAETIINHQKPGVRKIYELYEFDKEKEYWLTMLSEEIERIVGSVGGSIGDAIRMTSETYDVEELRKLATEMPLTEVGRHLGISDNAVRKRCKKHGIELKPKGFWLKGRARGW